MSDIVYGYQLNSEGQLVFKPNYIGQTDVPHETRSYQHGHTDKNSAIFKDSKQKNYTVKAGDFRILERGYSKVFDRNISEALHVKEVKPVLNAQKTSYKLMLFN